MADDVVTTARVAWSAAFDGMPAPPVDAVRPGQDSDFFRAGGTSMLALTVTAQLSDELGEDIPVRLLLQNPSFGAFTAALRAYLDEPAAAEPDLAEPDLAEPAGERVP
jgi:hypothetical protein